MGERTKVQPDSILDPAEKKQLSIAFSQRADYYEQIASMFLIAIVLLIGLGVFLFVNAEQISVAPIKNIQNELSSTQTKLNGLSNELRRINGKCDTVVLIIDSLKKYNFNFHQELSFRNISTSSLVRNRDTITAASMLYNVQNGLANQTSRFGQLASINTGISDNISKVQSNLDDFFGKNQVEYLISSVFR